MQSDTSIRWCAAALPAALLGATLALAGARDGRDGVLLEVSHVSSTPGFFSPSDVTVAPDGSIFVADTGNERVVRLRADKPARGAMKPTGTIHGGFNQPKDVAVTGRGAIIVADTMNNRIVLFDRAGEPLRELANAGRAKLYAPHSVSLTPKGNLLVSDAMNHRIVELDGEGEVVRAFGGFGDGDGQMKYPHDAIADSKGNIYVADFEGHRIQKFDAQGKYLATFGRPGNGPGEFHHPWGLAIDEKDGLLYVGDMSNHRVQVLTTDGQFIAKIGEGILSFPKGVALSGGSLYVAVPGHGTVEQFRVQLRAKD